MADQEPFNKITIKYKDGKFYIFKKDVLIDSFDYQGACEKDLKDRAVTYLEEYKFFLSKIINP